MYIMIFKAKVLRLDDNYVSTAARMRALAFEKYGCASFDSVMENGLDISVSHWPDLAHMEAWREDPEHRIAQEGGRSCWYESYSVQVAKVIQEYGVGAGIHAGQR